MAYKKKAKLTSKKTGKSVTVSQRKSRTAPAKPKNRYEPFRKHRA